MIHLDGVRAKALPRGARLGAELTNLTLRLEAGCHALVEAAPAHARLLLDLVAGHARATRGQVRVLGAAPGGVLAAAGTAYVPLDVPLPDGLTVTEVAELEAELRATASVQSAQRRLETLDLGALGARVVHTLSARERRAVALALALTSGARVLLLEEPLVELDGRAGPRVAGALRALVQRGEVCVLLSTASRHDAGLLGARRYSLTGERLVALGVEGGAHALAIVADEPMRLAAALAAEGTTAAIHSDRTSLLVETSDLEATAATVARVAVHAALAIRSMSARPMARTEPAPPAAPIAPVPETPSASGGDAAPALETSP